MTSLASRSRPIALALRDLLRDLDPSRFRSEVEASARRRIADMAAAIRSLVGDGKPDDLVASLDELAKVLGEQVPAPALPSEDASAAWTAFRKQLSLGYESLRQRLRARDVGVPALRPTNYTRSLFHALTGVSCLVLIEYLLGDRGRAAAPTAFALTFWFLEGLRRVSPGANRVLMRLFRHIAHPREAHHVNSSTWYATALALLGIFAPLPICAMAIAVIAFADPAASLVGRRWGKLKLVGDRSLVGTLTFTVVGTLVGFGALALWHHDAIAPLRALAIAAAAALAAALTELFSRRVDDNFSVPMVAAAVGWLALALS